MRDLSFYRPVRGSSSENFHVCRPVRGSSCEIILRFVVGYVRIFRSYKEACAQDEKKKNLRYNEKVHLVVCSVTTHLATASNFMSLIILSLKHSR